MCIDKEMEAVYPLKRSVERFTRHPIEEKSIEYNDWMYTGDTEDGIPNGHGTGLGIGEYNELAYSGFWKNGHPHGFGVLTGGSKYQGGIHTIYSGNWKNGTPVDTKNIRIAYLRNGDDELVHLGKQRKRSKRSKRSKQSKRSKR